jgi:polysaccharide export outer membrane protein
MKKASMFIGRFASCLGLVFLAVGFLRAAAPEAKPVASASAGTHVDYVLKPGDQIAVRVLDQPALTEQMSPLLIAQDYTIKLPYLNEPLNLQGKTLREAEQLITDRYKPDYLKNPTIRVIVVQHFARTVNVMGKVAGPRAVPIPPDKPLKLMDAIIQSGGFTPIADPKKVKLLRTNADGTKAEFMINTTKPMQDPQGNPDWPLQPEDIIDVQEIWI